MDFGSKYADKRERILELRLQRVYREAQKDLEKQFDSFLEQHKEKGQELWAQLVDGKIDKQQYSEWMRGQVFIGKQWKNRIETMTERLKRSNEAALSIIRGEQYNVFAENANYESYSIEKDMNGGIRFDIYDEDTVERLVEEKPELLPRKVVNGKKDKAWNQGVISNAVTQAILQGESIDKLAKRLARDTASTDMKAMVRYARTAMTGAQNAGRIETMRRSESMGISVKKQWLATLDARTRDSHAALDGEIAEVNKKFANGLMYPGDPSGAAGEVYNCRCTLVYVYPEFMDEDATRRDNESREIIKDMTYKEWSEWRKSQAIEEDKGNESKLAALRSTVRQKLIERGFGGDIDEETKGIILDGIDDMPEAILRIVDKTIGNATIEWRDRPLTANDVSHYNPQTGSFVVYRKDFYGDERDPVEIRHTFWHEYGHFVDDARISQSGFGVDTEYAGRLAGVFREIKKDAAWEKAACRDANAFLERMGLSGKYEAVYRDGMYGTWIYKNGEAVDVRLPDVESWNDLQGALESWSKSYSGIDKAYNYLYDQGLPRQPDMKDYIEVYFTPKRNLYREREKYEGAREAYFAALRAYDEEVEKFWETHDREKLIDEYNAQVEKAKARYSMLGEATDTFDGGVSGAFLSCIIVGGHDAAYYCRNDNGAREGVANVFGALANNNTESINAMKDLCPNIYSLISGAIMK